jgi:hypothetical protein
MVRRPPGPKPVAGGQEVGFEDRLEHDLHRRHHHPIGDARNPVHAHSAADGLVLATERISASGARPRALSGEDEGLAAAGIDEPCFSGDGASGALSRSIAVFV